MFVSDLSPNLGDRVALFLRVPREFRVDGVWVRATPDGQGTLTGARIDREDAFETWWRVDLKIHNPITNYRWLIRRGRVIEWLTQAGLQWWEPTDAQDFRIVAYAPPPSWPLESIFYQIFPDRFARAHTDWAPPSWAIPAAWDDPLLTAEGDRVRQFYGGDLDGIVSKLDHIQELGANSLYLTPVFQADSNHRYNASSFEWVDPYLGGDEALTRLTTAAHERGMRVICDFTANHCGLSHEWFRTAQADPTSSERDFFYFRKHPEDYIGWLGVRGLPKFNHRSEELRRRLYEGPESVFGRWLQPPFDIDGWRIDVANMSGRYGDVDLNSWIARAMRWTMFMTKPDAYLVAEHFFDATRDLTGDGWHGVMNYAGFARPVWQWLASPNTEERPWYPVLAPTSGVIAYLTMRDYMAAVPWVSALNNLNLLDSHDTARFVTLADTPEIARVGIGILMTFVGIPMLFAGDEIGLEGQTADDSRRPMPWGDRSKWSHDLFDWYKRLIALRRSSPALQRGGFRWVSVGDDSLAFLRETRDETVLVQASRRASPIAPIDASALGARSAENLIGGASLTLADGKLVLPSDGPSFNVWRLHRDVV